MFGTVIDQTFNVVQRSSDRAPRLRTTPLEINDTLRGCYESDYRRTKRIQMHR